MHTLRSLQRVPLVSLNDQLPTLWRKERKKEKRKEDASEAHLVFVYVHSQEHNGILINFRLLLREPSEKRKAGSSNLSR